MSLTLPPFLGADAGIYQAKEFNLSKGEGMYDS